ncbi:MAG: hypothetical protein ACR2OY_14140 [Boseongicola sp.]
MTVLAAYQRLEAEGVWRPDADAQRRDVIVAIGEATLTISDHHETALTHWSLPAIRRLNPGEHPAVFSPGSDAPETLEIADTMMVDALSKVLRAIRRKGRHPGRLRIIGVASAIAVIAVVAIFWLPGALASYTAGILPDAARMSMGRDMSGHIRQLTGAPCETGSGRRALETLSARLFPEKVTRIEVLQSALATTQHLPGGTLLISNTLIEDFETPEVLAGFLLAEDLRRTQLDPLERTMRHAGLLGAIRILTTGALQLETLKSHAEHLITEMPKPVPAGELATAAQLVGVSLAGYADVVDDDIKGALQLSQQTKAEITPLLGDGDWLALQQICER